jgi:glycosyltransferase involved in cell wall biosynthesis
MSDSETANSTNSISIVVPVYNSAISLKEFVRRVEPVLTRFENHELILVNDGSADDSWDLIQEIASKYEWVLGINLIRNFGQHNALLCGIREAHFDVIVTMDDDLQHPPEEIPRLIAELEKGYDVVYGIPETQKHSLFRSMSSSFTKWLIGVALGMPHVSRSGAFRIFRTKLRDAFSDYQNPYVSIDVLVGWGTSKFGYLSVRHDPRFAGKSNYTLFKLVQHTFNMITGFSTLPLRLASLFGFLFTLLGFSVFVYVIGRYLLYGSSVEGFPFLASIIALFSGVQLFAMGIFGEYLARMYYRSIGRPPSVARETVGLHPKQEHSDD